MTDKLSLIISIAALALAGLSPIASAVVQLVTRKKELDAEAQRRQAEFYDQHRAEVIERYITAVGEICKTESPQDLHAYGKSLGEIYLYVDSSLWPKLDAISKAITLHDFQAPAEELIQLCKELSHKEVRAKK